MRTRTGPAGSEIVGLGHFQPERVMTNAEIERLVDTSDEWIRQRTGIETRHIASESDTVATMAAGAASHALADAGAAPDEVDLVIVATTTAEDRSPNTAGRVARDLGLSDPAILDINTACSGFEYALALADQSIRTGAASSALVIGSEKLTAFTDWTDRTTCVLTADGAGAALVRGTDDPGVGPVAWGSKTDIAGAVRIEAPSGRFAQDGRNILRWALTDAVSHARRALDLAGVAPEEIEVLACHQANLRIVEPLAEQLGMTDRIVLADVVESGNTSAASVPLGLSKWWHSGRIPAGVPALLFGFGGGFTFAGQVARTPRR